MSGLRILFFAFLFCAPWFSWADLAGLWRFDNTNDVGFDSSISANHLEAVGDAQVTTNNLGRFGEALLLDGAGDWLGMPGDLGGDYTNSFPVAIPTNGASYTISLWIQPSINATVRDGFIGWGNYGTQHQVNAFRLSSGAGVVNYWWGNDLNVTSSGTNLKNGDWHHVLAVYDAGRMGNDHFLYINGEPVAQRTSNDALDVKPENFRIGITNGENETYDGLIDDVAVYDHALTGAEIEHLSGGGDPLNLPAPGPGAPRYYTGPFGPGGTWNLYGEFGRDLPGETPVTWYEAHVAATNAPDPLMQTTNYGHLVAITSLNENFLVKRIRNSANTWIGFTDDDTLFGATESGGVEVGLGVRRTNGWIWVTGEPFEYTNWLGNQPDDAGVGEDGGEMSSSGQWNDNKSGIPGAGQDTGVTRAYVVEWEINAVDPIPGAIVLSVLPADVMPGPEGGNGTWGGRWVRDNGGVSSIESAVKSLLSGAGTVIETNNIPVINASDPDNDYNNNGLLFSADLPFFADLQGAEDQNYAVVYKATLAITNAGDYTFGVHSDDGFALRIRGFEWSSVSGLGRIDSLDPQTIYWELGTGDSNTRGIINLPVGNHSVEFVTWNGTGGRYHELYAAEGAFSADGDTATWELVGAQPGIKTIPNILGTNVWEVWHSDPGAHGSISDTNTAWAAITNYLPVALGGNQPDPDGSNKTVWAEINFGSGNQGEIGGDNPFPFAPANANIAIFARTQLVITNAENYIIGFRGDDGSWMRVVGERWNRLVYEEENAAYVDGERIVLNQGTGNSRMFGEISLSPGTYEVEFLWWQGVGGFQLEVLNGVVVNGRVFTDLMNTNATSFTYDGGVQIVAPDDPQSPDITEIRYDPVAHSVFVTWNSEPGATYRLVFSTDNGSGADFNPIVWNDLLTGVGSAGVSTTVELPDFLGTPWQQAPPWVGIRVADE